jgi:hypothetical protein
MGIAGDVGFVQSEGFDLSGIQGVRKTGQFSAQVATNLANKTDGY